MRYQSGDVAIAPFTYTDLTEGKNRPILLLAPLPNYKGDWLASMVTSQLHHFVEGLDVLITADHSDFIDSGLKVASLIRVSRLMVINEDHAIGTIGRISSERADRVISNLIQWLQWSMQRQ
jgi:mRNA interferase MazF